MISDPRSVAGKTLAVDEIVQVLVIGGGPAGLTAARAVAELGLGVVLVEEHPVPAETIGLDVPLHFGGRADGAVRNRNAMLEAVLDSDPEIAAAFEAGVDVRLGTAAWGLWSNDRSVGWLPGLVVGLMSEGAATLVQAERVVVATGRRDMGLAFPGWELPGVMGATAAEQLLRRYGALAARRAVVLGSTPEAVATCHALIAAGIEVAGIIEQDEAPVDPAAAELGAPLLLRHAPRRAEGGAEVQALVVGEVDAEGRAIGAERRIECDTILLAVGAVPQVELLDACGAAIRFDRAAGGHVPVLDADGQTSLPGVFAAGDSAGLSPAKSRDRRVAEQEGRRAGEAIARSFGIEAPFTVDAHVPAGGRDHAAERLGWVRACAVEACRGSEGTAVCQCEEVTAREIMEVRPPRYLGWAGNGRNAVHDLRSLVGAGPPDQDQVKRLTRAGMGLCQGRRCREQVAALLALATGSDLAEAKLATHRAPVRPIPLAAAADGAEPAAMTAQWDTWFGMASQYLPPWEVTPRYTVAGRGASGTGEVSSE